MTFEFYGEISEYTKKRTDRLKKRYFAQWLFLAAGILLVASLIASFLREAFIVLLICAIVVGLVGCLLYFLPMKKSMTQPWKVRVLIDGDQILWTQYLQGRELQKKKRVSDIKKVYRTKYCYYLIYNDISNAIICERCLLKRGTFDSFEMLFEGKIRNKAID